jgi:streptogramin lyase
MIRALWLTSALLAATALSAHPPVSVVIDSRGNVYYSDLSRVWRISPDGKETVVVRKVHTHELALDAEDNLYGEHLWYEGERSDKWSHYVWRLSPDGKLRRVIPSREGFLKNYSFVRDATGNMYWADRGQYGFIRRKAAADNSIRAVAQGLKNVRWMHATPSGTLYLIDGRDLVRVRDKKVTRIAKKIAGGRHSIMGLWTDRDENVYLADYAHNQVLRVSQDGEIRTVYRSRSRWSPTGGTFDRDGTLWLLEWSSGNRARVIRVRLDD